MQLLDLIAFSRINTTEHQFEETDLHVIIEDIKSELKDDISLINKIKILKESKRDYC